MSTITSNLIMTFEQYEKDRQQRVVDIVNEMLGLSLELRTDVKSRDVIARDKQNRYHAIICTYSNDFVLLRGVVRQTRKDRPWTWLINGQAGKNCTQIHYNGEERFEIPKAVQLRGRFVLEKDIKSISISPDTKLPVVTLTDGDAFSLASEPQYVKEFAGVSPELFLY